jgi:hypothetical protein
MNSPGEGPIPNCPACGRKVAVARAECLYCGASLGRGLDVPVAADAAPSEAAKVADRVLVLLDAGSTAPELLAGALSLSSYEAGLVGRRGGLHLVRAVASDAAAAEAERLRALGAIPLLVPEAEVRARPILCLAGERQPSGLLLRTGQGSVTLAPGEAFLVVSGPITREYQPTAERRRIATARLEEGFRVHVHRRGADRPLEIDALNLEVGFAATGSVRLEIEAWLDAVAAGAPRDTGFSRLPPVLGAAEPDPRGALAAAGSLAAAAHGRAGDERALVLDNVAQFRFYSGCLAAVARRRAP